MSTDFVFMVGTGRCGSTLLHEVLARHPGIGFLSNIDDNLRRPVASGRYNNAIYRRIPSRFTEKGGLRFAPSEAYQLLDRRLSPIVSTPFRDLRADDVTPWLEGRVR